MKKRAYLIIFLFLSILLCGCQQITVKQIINSQNFITVKRGSDVLNFDLKSKRIFDSTGFAYKDGYMYMKGNVHEEKKWKNTKEYSELKNESLLYDVISSNDTLMKIRKHNYILIKNGNYSMDGVNVHRIKIYYNHRGLPTRLYSYSFQSKAWKYRRSYSYPYHSQRKYNKDLDNCIKEIMSGNLDDD
ncbi:hypothetical protein [Limosilactobacillus gastricus]|uniref:hypothetical protein n=1 Tax=Limosilactobacillus gastricus TaxID=227942 RepID=UPI00058DCF61|nr:hypothetical protein [Limosilactobacillus gastricus]